MKLNKNETQFKRAQLKREQRKKVQLNKAELLKGKRKKDMKFVIIFLTLALLTTISAILNQTLYGISSFIFELLFLIFLTLFFSTMTINMVISLRRDGKISFGFKCLNAFFIAIIIWCIYDAVRLSVDISSIATSNYSIKSGTITAASGSTSRHGHTSMSFWIDETYFYTDNFPIMNRIKKGKVVEVKYLPASKYIIELKVKE